MQQRVIIEGGILATEDGPLRADLVVDRERISAITLDATDIPADERIDARGLIVAPGCIGAHTHFTDFSPPSTEPREGFVTGSLGAIAGGVTAIIEMPHSTPCSTTGSHIKEQRRRAEAESIVDFAFWGGAINQPMEQIDEMLAEGVVAIKAYMVTSRPEFPAMRDDTILTLFEHLADTGVPIGFHAENNDLRLAGAARMQQEGRKDAFADADSRPPIVELESIDRILFFAEQTGGLAYICHTSITSGLELIKQAKARGIRAMAETCPQYLTSDRQDPERLGPYGRCSPPLRSREEVEGLWQFIADGTMDVISSDHCGFSIESHEAARDDIWQAPGGLSGIQTLAPLMFDEIVHQRGLGLETFVRLTASNPARIFGLWPRKGAIRVGADADLALYDPEQEWTVRGADMLHRYKWTPFEGRQVRGRVVRTLIRGRTVYHFDGAHRVLAKSGVGRFLPRDYGSRETE